MKERELLHKITSLLAWSLHIEPGQEEYSIDLDKDVCDYARTEIRHLYEALFPEDS